MSAGRGGRGGRVKVDNGRPLDKTSRHALLKLKGSTLDQRLVDTKPGEFKGAGGGDI